MRSVIARARSSALDVRREDGRRVAGAWGGSSFGDERDARKNVWLQREALVAAQSRTHENTKLLDEAKANLDKEEKAAAFKAREATAEKPENGDGEEPPPAADDAPESTLQIRVRVLAQKAEDLKAEERKVTSSLEQAADAADHAPRCWRQDRRPTRLS